MYLLSFLLIPLNFILALLSRLLYSLYPVILSRVSLKFYWLLAIHIFISYLSFILTPLILSSLLGLLPLFPSFIPFILFTAFPCYLSLLFIPDLTIFHHCPLIIPPTLPSSFHLPLHSLSFSSSSLLFLPDLTLFPTTSQAPPLLPSLSSLPSSSLSSLPSSSLLYPPCHKPLI